jgi:hypothetical protein
VVFRNKPHIARFKEDGPPVVITASPPGNPFGERRAANFRAGLQNLGPTTGVNCAIHPSASKKCAIRRGHDSVDTWSRDIPAQKATSLSGRKVFKMRDGFRPAGPPREASLLILWQNRVLSEMDLWLTVQSWR